VLFKEFYIYLFKINDRRTRGLFILSEVHSYYKIQIMFMPDFQNMSLAYGGFAPDPHWFFPLDPLELLSSRPLVRPPLEKLCGRLCSFTYVHACNQELQHC